MCPRIIKTEISSGQQFLGAILIVGAVFVVPLCGIFGIIGFAGKGLKKLNNVAKRMIGGTG